VSEPRHTPGPWEVFDMGLSDGRLTIGAEEKTICDTLNDMLDSEDEHIANAYLIAAAPELYAAACDVVADFEESVSRYPSLLRLAAAIAKAEGRG